MMMHIRRFLVTILAAGSLGAVLVTAHAQTDPAADPPGRAARLADVEGQVWTFAPDGSGEWTAANRNRVITTGDHLATDAGGHAEIQLGSTAIRLDGGTEVEVTQLDDSRFAVHLLNGSVYARVADLDAAGPIEIDTDEGRFPIQRNGAYRIDRDNGTSRLSVLSGLARYEGQNSGMPVNPGQRAEFWLDSGGVAQYTMASPVNDAFMAWNAGRDRALAAPVAARYVSPEMTGVVDLDRYGNWEQTPDYGPVWIPTAVAADWAPYRAGHWAWVAPWGWTWIDDAPWGFAPFHYGRWVNVRDRWCWTPGQRVVRPVYAPALVAWVGAPGANVSLTIGGGPAVGWFPLAPREVYVPSYRVSPHYAQSININIVGNPGTITRVFANPEAPRDFGNRRWPGAVTVVPAAVMTSRQPVAPAWAQLRQNPNFARSVAAPPPGRPIAALMAPPVAAPSVRHVDARDVRPPPGFPERAGPPPGGPGPGDRDRGGRGRDVSRPESPRPPQGGGGAMQPPPQGAGMRPPQAEGGAARPAPGARPEAAMQAPAGAAPIAGQAGAAQRPGQRPGENPEPGRFDRRDERSQPSAPAPNAQAPAALSRPQVPTTVQEGPMMRAPQVRRGDERERREDAPRAPQAQPQTPQAPQAQPQRPQAPQPSERPIERPQPPQHVERPAVQAPVMRAPEAPRMPQPQQQPEMRRPEAPRAQPEMRRPEPPQGGGEQRGGGGDRRNEQQR